MRVFTPTSANADQQKKSAGRGKMDQATAQRQVEAGIRLRQRREEFAYIGSEVAKAIDIPLARYYTWELNFPLKAQQKYLVPLAKFLEVAPEWISDGVGVPPVASVAANAMLFPKQPQLTEQNRIDLAVRAAARRKFLRLKTKTVTKYTGLNPQTFRNLEECIPKNPKPAAESKLEELLQVPAGWLRSLAIEIPAIDPSTLTFSCPSAVTVSDEIRAIGCWLARDAIFGKTPDYFSLTPLEQRYADIFAHRYGTCGEDASTPEAISAKFDVSVTWIRTIIVNMNSRASALMGATPILDRLEAELPGHLPMSIENLDTTFRPQLGDKLSLISVERFASDILGSTFLSYFHKPHNKSLGSDALALDAEKHNPTAIRTVRDVAMTMIRMCGAAQIDFMSGVVGSMLDRAVSRRETIQLCSAFVDFEWIVEEDGWFWFGEQWTSRLLTVTKKVLCAARRRVDIEDIYSAMARSRKIRIDTEQNDRFYAVDAPHAVLSAILRRVSWLNTVQQNDFELKNPISPASVLAHTELCIYELLLARGGIAARYSINQELLAPGPTQCGSISLSVALSSSPIITRLDNGIYALRGAALTPDALELASTYVGGDIRSANRGRLASDSEGYLNINLVIKPHMITARYVDVPVKLAALMETGEYQMNAFEEKVVFTVLPTGRHRWLKFASKLVALGIGVGDVAWVRVNPQTRHIILEKYQAP